MSRRGFTLIEVMMAVGLMTVVVGILVTLSLGIGRSASAQTAKTNATEEGRRAMETLVARVRAASAGSINAGSLPGDVLRFRPAMDTNGNGTAVDVNGRIELGPEVTVRPDVDDINRDGVAGRQLVMIQGNNVRVLCNLLPPDSANKTGGVPLVRGFWVAPRDGGLDITIQTESRDNRGQPYRVPLTEFVMPRNN